MPTENLKKSSVLEACEKEDKEVIAKPANSHKNISTNEGTRKLKKKFNSSGEEVEVRPIPEGRPSL